MVYYDEIDGTATMAMAAVSPLRRASITGTSIVYQPTTNRAIEIEPVEPDSAAVVGEARRFPLRVGPQFL